LMYSQRHQHSVIYDVRAAKVGESLLSIQQNSSVSTHASTQQVTPRCWAHGTIPACFLVSPS
jgi:hypothetical protein